MTNLTGFENNLPVMNVEGALRTLEIAVDVIWTKSSLCLCRKVKFYNDIQQVYNRIRREYGEEKEEN